MDKEAILEEGVGPLIGGAVGGTGGYLAGKHLVNPFLERKEKQIHKAVLHAEDMLRRLRRLRKITPIAGGAIGALLLATLTARSAKRQERDRMTQYGDSKAYQYGLNPSDIRPFP